MSRVCLVIIYLGQVKYVNQFLSDISVFLYIMNVIMINVIEGVINDNKKSSVFILCLIRVESGASRRVCRRMV